MADSLVENLIHDLLEWLSKRERTYDEVLDAWRTSCPKLPVWEDANDRGLVTMEEVKGRRIVIVTYAGREFQKQRNAKVEKQHASSPPP